MDSGRDIFINHTSGDIDQYLNIFSNAPFAVIISDETDRIIFANNSASDWFAIDPENEKRITIASVLPKNIKKWQQLRKDLINNTSASFHGRHIEPALTHIHLFCKKVILNSKPLFISYIRNITEQKRLEAELLNEKATRQLILDSIPAFVFVKDTENHILSMNRAYRENTGLTMEQVAGKNLLEFMENKSLAEDYLKDDIEVIETGLPKRNIIEPMITDDSRWFITDKIPYRDNTGKVTGIIGFSIDITERKNAEDALMRSEKRFRQLFDTSPDGIAISNLNGRILNANKVFCTLLNYSVNEISKLHFQDITPDKYDNMELNFIQNAITGGAASEKFEKEYISRNNILIPVAITCWILFDDTGKPAQLVANVKDLTYQKKAEQLEKSLLKKEKEQLENDLKTKTQQLNSKITQLIEKNELVNNLIVQLNKLKGLEKQELINEINAITRDLQSKTNEDFWTQFETTFGQINQSFYDNIYLAYPNLTNNERKISAFLKMNLSTKDIANITHQSIRSIEMARSRLRTKLNLSRKDNLSKFLNQF
jgi:PAS domain S-box-containing protein